MDTFEIPDAARREELARFIVANLGGSEDPEGAGGGYIRSRSGPDKEEHLGYVVIDGDWDILRLADKLIEAGWVARG
jgi:hypothetical protein